MNISGHKFKSSLLFCCYNLKTYSYRKVLLVCARTCVEISYGRIRSAEERKTFSFSDYD